MATDMMPRTPGSPRPSPGRGTPAGRGTSATQGRPSGRGAPPVQDMPAGRGVPSGRRTTPPGRRTAPPGRGTPPAAGRDPSGRADPRSRGRTDLLPPRAPRTPQTASLAKAPSPAKTPKPAKALKPAKPAKAPKPAKPAKAPKPAKPAKPPKTRAPRHTRPITAPGPRPVRRPAPEPAPRPVSRPAAGWKKRPRHPRAPFILLLVGLLGGALVCLLVISTTLAEGSYQITHLQQENTVLARQEQVLTDQVAQASSPAQIAQEAEALGMRQNPKLQFINLKTGKIVTGKPTAAQAAINVPGFNP